MQKPSVFISYNWNSGKNIAEQLENKLNAYAYVCRDEGLRTGASLANFMKSIKTQDLAVFLISDSYLKSKNCLIEVIERMKVNKWEESAQFVVLNDAKVIYSVDGHLDYIKYWENKYNELNNKLKGQNAIAFTGQTGELKQIHEIYTEIGEFLETVKNTKNPDEKYAIDEVVNWVRGFTKTTSKTGTIQTEDTALNVDPMKSFKGQSSVSRGVSDNNKGRTWFSKRLEEAINYINNTVVNNSVVNPVYELNIASLSKLLGEPSTVLLEKYVQGSATPELSDLKRIASILGLNEDWLLTGNGVPTDIIECRSIDELKNVIEKDRPTYIWIVYDRTGKDLHFILQFNEYSFRYVKYRLIFHRVLSHKWESELVGFYNLIIWAEGKNRIYNKHFRFRDELYVIDYDLGYAVMYEKKHPAIAIRNPEYIYKTFINDFRFYDCDDEFKEIFRKTYDGDLEFEYLQNIIRCRMGQNKLT